MDKTQISPGFLEPKTLTLATLKLTCSICAVGKRNVRPLGSLQRRELIVPTLILKSVRWKAASREKRDIRKRKRNFSSFVDKIRQKMSVSSNLLTQYSFIQYVSSFSALWKSVD